jgi:uncharacterized protein YndB with AHSA1/START domain
MGREAVRPDPSTAAQMVIVRTYPARIEELWALWTTAEGFASWWGPQGFRVEVSIMEPRVGGLLRYEMIADAPAMVAAMRASGQPLSHGVDVRFAECDPHSRLVLKNTIDFLPGVPTYESTLAVDFVALGDSTCMTVTLHPMHNEAVTRMQLQGFTSQLGKLDLRYGVGGEG